MALEPHFGSRQLFVGTAAFVGSFLAGILPLPDVGFNGALGEAAACSPARASIELVAPTEGEAVPPDAAITVGYIGVTANGSSDDLTVRLEHESEGTVPLERQSIVSRGIVGNYIRFAAPNSLSEGNYTLVATFGDVAHGGDAGLPDGGTRDAGGDAGLGADGGTAPGRRTRVVRQFSVDADVSPDSLPSVENLRGAAADLEGDAAFCSPGPKGRVQFDLGGGDSTADPLYAIVRFETEEGDSSSEIISGDALSEGANDHTLSPGIIADCVQVELVASDGRTRSSETKCNVQECRTLDGSQWRGEQWDEVCPENGRNATGSNSGGGSCHQSSNGSPPGTAALLAVGLLGLVATRRRRWR